MNSITPVLIDYWQRLPGRPADSRRRSVEDCCRRVRAGELPAAALVTYALGDIDDEVVFAAATGFVRAARAAADAGSPVDDAIEWVRRGLALNRGAVFAALLSAGDASVNERLAAHRLTLSSGEVATVCRKIAGDGRKPTLAFLRNWVELLGGDAALPEVASLTSALGAVSPLDS
jgi:hypothetical protein